MHLLFICRPSAIVRAVWSVIVDSVNCPFWPAQTSSHRAVPHVGEKQWEAIPSLANRYASAAVIFVVFTVWIVASVAHIKPYMVNRVSPQSVGCIFRNSDIGSKAAARLSVAFAGIVGGRFGGFTTITIKNPYHAVTGSLGSWVYGQEFSEALSSDVDCLHSLTISPMGCKVQA